MEPIHILIEKTKLVAAGDFNQTIETNRRDEMGDMVQAFNQMTADLKKARESERLTAIGKAATAIAHELKNSLIMASTYIGLLPKRREDKEFVKQASEILPQELDSWKAMLQEISDFSRGSRFELESLDVKPFMENLISFIRHRLEEHRVDLKVRITEPLPRIQANAQKLKQLIVNLIINALNAMPGGGSLELECYLQNSEGSQVCIRLKDSGKGIPEEKMRNLFEPFGSLRAGSGLGLAICRQIAEQHGGRIHAESEMGKGTSFTVVIPAA